MRYWIQGFCLLSLMSWSLAATAGELRRFEYTERHMGVDFKLTFYCEGKEAADKAGAAAFARVAQLNKLFSDWDSDSELMQLCIMAEAGKPQPVSSELMEVLLAAQKVSEQSGGAFDVTVGRIVRQWRRARLQKELPSQENLREALELTGYQLLELDAENKTITFQKAGLRLDLGGIAKGYAGDEVLKVLRKHGITRVLVAASGDIVAGDPPPGRKGWSVAIGSLNDPNGKPELFLEVANRGVSTAGDAYQFVEINGVRYSHIVDPKTGMGLTSHSSTTVIAPSGMQADALDSAVSVMGPIKGLEMINKLMGIECLVVYRNGEQQNRVHTEGFEAFVQPEKP